jgi:hypothetical protein
MLAAPGVEAIASQLSAEVNKRQGKKNKKTKEQCRPAPDLCGPQLTTCTTILTVSCGGDAECMAYSTTCCSLLATCDADGSFVCLGLA